MAFFSWSRWLRSLLRPQTRPIQKPRTQLRLEALEARLAPAQFVWIGGAGDGKWGSGSNWQGGVAPSSSTPQPIDLSFQSAPGTTNLNNNVTNLSVNSITFSSNFNISGNAITLGSNGSGFPSAGRITVNGLGVSDTLGLNLITLAGGGSATAQQTISVSTNNTLTLNGQLSGTAGKGLLINGGGTVVLAADDSLYTGPIEINGTVTQITNSFALGPGNVANGFNDATTVDNGGQLQVNNLPAGTAVPEYLQLNGTGIGNKGALYVVGGVNSTWAGPIELDSDSTFGALTSTALTITGVISDLGSGHNVTKEGQGIIDFGGTDTYRGTTTINNGTLQVSNSQGLGTGPGGLPDDSTADDITVNNTATEQGTLQLVGPAAGNGLTIVNKLLILNAGGFAGQGALNNKQGNNTWTGNVILSSPAPNGAGSATIETLGTYTLTISGVVENPYIVSNLIKTGVGTLDLTNSNTYGRSGKNATITWVDAGILEVQDSQAMGQVGNQSNVFVTNNATLELAVNNAVDSITGVRNKMIVSNPVTIWGAGSALQGALYNLSGINQYAGQINVSPFDPGHQGTLWTAGASIGVAADPNPTNDANYFTNDYSLTVTGALVGAGFFQTDDVTRILLQKFGAGQLIVPNANKKYDGDWDIAQGWVTIENNNSLGVINPTVSQAAQISVTVDDGAALHLYDKAGTGLNLGYNFLIAGTGINHTFTEINQQGAIENIAGVNAITGPIYYEGTSGLSGIGVEQLGLPQLVSTASQLSLLGTQSDVGPNLFQTQASGNGSSGSSGEEEDNVIDTGSTSGTVTINYNMFLPLGNFDGVPDKITVYDGILGQGGTVIGTTGYVFGQNPYSVSWGPSSSTYITIVMNQGGNTNPFPFGVDAWNYTLDLEPAASTAGGLIKLGSGLLDVQGDGNYTGGVEVQAGVLLDQNDTGLGAPPTGATVPSVIVDTGATLALANGTAYSNGGVVSGTQIWDEHLYVGNPADPNAPDAPDLQVLTITGAQTGTFQLTFGASTITEPDNVTLAQLSTDLNKMASVQAVGGVTVTQVGDEFKVLFGSVQQLMTVSNVTDANVFISTGIGETSLGAPVGNLAVWSTTTSPWNGATLLQSSAFLAGLTGGTVNGSAVGSANFVPVDVDWRGPVTLTTSLAADIGSGARLIIDGAMDDAANTLATGSDVIDVNSGELVLNDANTYRGNTYLGTSSTPGTIGYDPDDLNQFFNSGAALPNAADNPGAVVTVGNSQGLGGAGVTLPSGASIGNVYIQHGAQLQLEGAVAVAGKPVYLDGTGLSTATDSSTASWFQEGPAPVLNGQTNGDTAVSGRMTGIAVDANDPDVIYVGAAGGGAWKSLDGGKTWEQIFDDANVVNPGSVAIPLYVGAVSIDPFNANVVYVGTGEANNSGDSYYGTGIYMSVDGGHTWTLLLDNTSIGINTSQNPGLFTAITAIAVDSNDTPKDPATNAFWTDPNGVTRSRYIYIATNDYFEGPVNSELPNGRPAGQGNPGAGIWRYDMQSQTWFDLTAWESVTRMSPPTKGGFPTVTKSPAIGPGPNDDFRLTFPQGTTGSSSGFFGYGSGASKPFWQGTEYSDVQFVDGVLYMSLGSPGIGFPNELDNNYEQAGTAVGRVASPTVDHDPALMNAVYRCINPEQATPLKGNPTLAYPLVDATSPLLPDRPIWYVGDANPAPNSTTPRTYDKGGKEFPTDIAGLNGFSGPNFGGSKAGGQQVISNGIIKFAATPNNDAVYAINTNKYDYNGTDDSLQNMMVGTYSFDFYGNPELNWAATAQQPPNFLFQQGSYDITIAADNNGNVYVGGQDNGTGTQFIYWSHNGGATWTDISKLIPSPHTDEHAAAIDPLGNLLMGGDGGIYKFIPSQGGWVDLNNNLETLEMNSIAVDPLNPDIYLGAGQDNGAYLFSGSEDWEHVMDGDGGVVAIDPANPLIMYEVVNGFLVQSTTGGAAGSWNVIGPQFSGQYFPFVEDQINTDRLIVGGDTIYETDNAGASFVPLGYPGGDASSVAISTYQGTYEPDANFPLVSDLGANNYDPDTIYAVDNSVTPNVVYYTKDDGTLWKKLPAVPNSPTISSIYVDPRNRDNVFITCNDPVGDGLGRIYQLSYHANSKSYTWQEIGTSQGLPDVPVWSIVLDPHTGVLYAGTDIGVYALNGAAWKPFGTGMPLASIRSMTIDANTDMLTVATYGRSAFQVLLNDTAANAGALVSLSGVGQWNGPVNLTGPTTIAAGGTEAGQINNFAASLNIQGAINDFLAGTNTVTVGTVANSGTVIFSGPNSYDDSTVVADGVLVADDITALGSAASLATTTTVTTGTALKLETSVTYGGTLILDGAGPQPAYNGHNTGALESISNGVTYTGLIQLNSPNVTIGVDSGSTLTLDGQVTDAGGGSNLIKELTGTLILADSDAANPDDYGGSTYVYAGALQLAGPYALPANSSTYVYDGAQLQLAGGITVNDTVTVDLSGSGINGTGALLNVEGDNTFAGTILLDATPGFSPTTFPVGDVVIAAGFDGDLFDPTNILNLTGPIQDAAGAGTLYSGITKVGPDTLALGAQGQTSTYFGTTFIDNGYVRLQGTGGLGDNSTNDPLANDPIQRLTGDDPAQVGSFTLSLTVDGVTGTAKNISTAGTALAVQSAVNSALNKAGTGILAQLKTAGVIPNSLTASVLSASYTITNSSILEFVVTVVFNNVPAAIGVMPQLVALASGGATVIESDVADRGFGTEVFPEMSSPTSAGAGLQLDFPAASANTITGETLQLNGTGTGQIAIPTPEAANESGTTVTVTANNSFAPGDVVTIANLDQLAYDTTVLVSAATATSFSFTAPAGLGNSDPVIGETATATSATASVVIPTPQAVTEAGTTVTVAAVNNFIPGAVVTLSGLDQPAYDGAVTITAATATTFSFTAAAGLGGSNPLLGGAALATFANGALENVSGTNTWTGNATVYSTGITSQHDAIGADAAAGTPTQLSLNGIVSGLPSGELDKIGVGTVVLNGTNTYQGTTDVQDGILRAGNKLALGGAITDEVQTLTFAGALTGTFSLTYTDINGIPHTSANVSTNYNVASTLTALQGALDAICGAGNTIVQQAGAIYTVTFIGALAGKDQVQLALHGITSGSEVDIATTQNGGLGNTIVESGTTLQMAPNVHVATEQLVLNGSGDGGIGALEGLGNNTWDPNTTLVAPDPVAPDSSIILASDSAIGAAPGAAINVTQEIIGNANLTKVGTGVLIFGDTAIGASNTYSGLTTVAAGSLWLDKTYQTITGASEFGNIATVTTTASLGIVVGQMVVVSGVTPTGYDGEFQVTVVSNPAGGPYTFSYTDAVASGLGAGAGGAAGFVAVPNNLTIGTGTGSALSDLAEVQGQAQFSPLAIVTVNSDGLFDNDGQVTTIGTLLINDGTVAADQGGGAGGNVTINSMTMSGGTVTTNASGTVTLGGTVSATSDSQIATITGTGTFNTGGQTFVVTLGEQSSDLDVTLPIADTLSFTKTGTGIMELGADSSATAGAPTVQQGQLQVDGKINNVVLAGGIVSGGTLTTPGQVANVSGTGTVDPGDNGATNPDGFLQTNPAGTETWTSSVTYAPDLIDASNTHTSMTTSLLAGTDYDQLIVNGGTLDLGGLGNKTTGAILSGVVGANVLVGDAFTIIQAQNGGQIIDRFEEPFGEETTGPDAGDGIVYIQGLKFDVQYTVSTVTLLRVRENITTFQITSLGGLGNPVAQSNYGEDAQFEVTVQAENGAGNVPDFDTVTFTVDATVANPNGIAHEVVPLTIVGNQDFATFDPQLNDNLTVPVGANTVTVSFNGDPAFITPSPSSMTWNVVKDGSNIALAAAPTLSVVGQSITISATVTAATPGGMTPLYQIPSSPGNVNNVTFTFDANTSNQFTVLAFLNANGVATISLATLPVGTHTVAASYGGDGNYTSVNTQKSVNLSVTKDATTVTLLANPSSPGTVGQPVQLTAIVGAVAPGTAVPASGDTVQFVLDSNVQLGSAQVVFNAVKNDYEADLTVGAGVLSVGPHTIDATFSGDAQMSSYSTGINGGTLDYLVNPIVTTTTLTSSVDPAALNQVVLFTAAISSTLTDGAITGTVNFYDNFGLPSQALLGSKPVQSGNVALLSLPSSQTSAFTVGNNAITAVYQGATNYNTSSSAVLNEVVQYATVTTLTVTPSPDTYDTAVNLTANVTLGPGMPASAGTPTGTVLYYLDGSSSPMSGPVAVNNGAAILPYNGLSVGNHTILAVYTPTGSFETSTSALVTLPVDSATTTTLTTSANPAGVGDAVTLTATIATTSPGALSALGGTVTFDDTFNGVTTPIGSAVSVNPNTGVATTTISWLLAQLGTHQLEAFYSGNPGNLDAPSNSSLIGEIVEYAANVTSLTSSANPSPYGQQVTFTATLAPASGTPGSAGTPQGTVAFMDGNATIGTAAIVGTTATFATLPGAPLPVGLHNVTAVYEGNSTFAPATSSVLQQNVLNTTSTAIGSSLNPSTYGQSVTFTAVVTDTSGGPTPEGTVTFLDNGNSMGSAATNVALTNGSATFTTSALNAGNNVITVNFAQNNVADGWYQSTGTLAGGQVVNPANTSTSVTPTLTPTVFGQNATFNVTVTTTGSGIGTPVGFVNFFDGSSTTPLNASPVQLSPTGTASYTTNALSVGVHTIKAAFLGSQNFVTSSNTTGQSVNEASTSTALISSTAAPVVGQNVTFTATVSVANPGSGAPLGTVYFYDGSNPTPVGTGSLNASDQAFLTYPGLTLGGHAITAVYQGDGVDFLMSPPSNSVSESVGQDQTTTTLASSVNPSVDTQTVTFTATVTANSPGTGVPAPTGTVVFIANGNVNNPIGTGTLDPTGHVSIQYNGLLVGANNIQAVYVGDSNYVTSTSAALPETVNMDGTSTVITTSGSPSVYSQVVNFTVTVTPASPGSGTATGTVNLVDTSTGATVMSNQSLGAGGTVVIPVSTLDVGLHNIVAVFNTNSGFTTSTSPVVSQIVKADATTATLTSSLNPAGFGQSITLTAAVTANAPGTGIPQGTVTFTDMTTGQTLASGVTLNAQGQATYMTSSLAGGAHNIVASYTATTRYNASASNPTFVQTINAADTKTTVTAATNPTVFGQQAVFNITVAPLGGGSGTPQGTVTVLDGSATLGTATLNAQGQATFTTTAAALPVGNDSITATYTATANFNTSTSTALTQQVNADGTLTQLASAQNPSVYGQSIALTATVSSVSPGSGTPQGSVTFLSGATPIGSGTLTNGQVTVNVSSLAVGAYSITAVYTDSADSDYTTSTSNTVHQVVGAAGTNVAVTTSQTPSVLTQSVTLTATVTAVSPGGGVPQGTVTFFDNGSSIGTAAPNGSGVATLPTSSLAVGAHTITASYSDTTDSNYLGSTSAPITQVVNPVGTSTAISGPTSAVFSQPVTFTATVTASFPGSGAVTAGLVTFIDTTTNTTLAANVAAAGGVFSFTTSSLPVGTHNVIAQYLASPSYAASATTTPALISVSTDATTTSLASSGTPTGPSAYSSVFSQPVTLSAVVNDAPGTGMPAGTVTFKTGSTTLGSASVAFNAANNDFEADLATSTLAVGNDAITAAFTPSVSSQFKSSTAGAITETVSADAVNVAIVASVNPSVVNSSVSFTATVSAAAPGVGAPTGTVKFVDTTTGKTLNSTPITLAGGKATVTATLPGPIGTHTIQATYTPNNGDFLANTGSAGQGVFYASKTSVVASPTTSYFGDTVTFTATVAPGTGAPAGSPAPDSGNVTFYDGTTIIGNVGFSSPGVATFQYAGLAIGAHKITAQFSGDGTTYAVSTSAAVTETVYDVPVRIVATIEGKSPVSTATAFTVVVQMYDAAGNLITASPAKAVLSEASGPSGGFTTRSVAFTGGKTNAFVFSSMKVNYGGSYQLLVTVNTPVGEFQATVGLSNIAGRLH